MASESVARASSPCPAPPLTCTRAADDDSSIESPDVMICRIFAAVCLSLLVTTAQAQPRGGRDTRDRASSQHRAPRPDPTTQPAPAKPTTLPSAKPMFAEAVARLEDEIAGLNLRRPDVPVEQRPGLDARVDFRVVTRWLLLRAAEAQPESELQVNLFLRAVTMVEATGELEKLTGTGEANGEGKRESVAGAAPGTALSAAQVEVLRTINTLTYKLGEVKDAQQLDQQSARLGQLVLALASPAGQAKAPPLMRPKPAPVATGTVQAPPTTGGAVVGRPPVAQLAAEVRQMAVAPVLRKQLAELADRATTFATLSEQKPEAAALYDALVAAAELARGMQSSTALAPKMRDELEQRLAHGLALHMDVRTRPAGQARLDAMGDYRNTLSRIGRLPISPEMSNELSPAFVWAQSDVEEGPKVLSAIERFIELSMQHQKGGGAGGAFAPDAGADTIYTTALKNLEENFARRQGEFMTDAAGLGQGAAMSTEPSVLYDHVAQMHRAIEMARGVKELSKSIGALIALKPRPTGGLEKRIGQTLAEAVEYLPSGERDVATRMINDIRALAKAAGDAVTNDDGTGAIPDAVVEAYTDRRLASFGTKRKGLVEELTNQLASANGVFDAWKLARLQNANAMYEALAQAAALETALARTPALQRWADWTLSPTQLAKALTPYRESLAAAFVGFARDEDEPVQRWTRLRPRYAPFVEFVVSSATTYADACDALPGGLEGAGAKLMTPLAGQPFAVERYASFAGAVWARCERKSDFTNADAAALVVGERVE
ncbi:MAG: hypothetical protein ACREIT_02820 [Tepidisphaeraceae bacterium]